MLRPLSHTIPQEVIEGIVKNLNPNGRSSLKEATEQYALEVDEMARKAGYPEALIQLMRSRRERPSYTELARRMFPVEPMPEGAQAIYDESPVPDIPLGPNTDPMSVDS